MPLGRIILKSICQSKKLSLLKTDGARLLYTWLIPNLDVNGCYSGDAEVINGRVFTRLKKSTKTVESYIQDLENMGLVIRYSANGDIYLCIPDFLDKQPKINPDREGKTHIPKPTPEQLQSNSRVKKSYSNTSKVKLSKVKLNKSNMVKINKDNLSTMFSYFWDEYPKKVAKTSALKAFTKINVDKVLFDKIMDTLKKYKQSDQWKKDNGQFIPHASTWLNQERWNDEIKTEPTLKERLQNIKGD